MITFDQFRNLKEDVSLVEADEDEWIVELAEVQDDDIIEIMDEEGNVVDELEIVEKINNMKDVSRAVSRYNRAKTAQYRATGGANRKDKGMKAFKAQIKGRARSAANVATFGTAYKQQVMKGKSNFARAYSGSVDNEKRAARGWSPKKK